MLIVLLINQKDYILLNPPRQKIPVFSQLKAKL
jgi:hypothetical protein